MSWTSFGDKPITKFASVVSIRHKATVVTSHIFIKIIIVCCFSSKTFFADCLFLRLQVKKLNRK